MSMISPTTSRNDSGYDGSIRSILLRQGSESSTTSANSSTSQLRRLSWDIPPHPRASQSKDSLCWSKGTGGSSTVRYNIVPRRSKSVKFLGDLLDKVGLGSLNSSGQNKSPGSVNSADEEKETRRRKRSRSQRRRDRATSDPFFDPSLLTSLPMPVGADPFETRAEQNQYKLDWLFIRGAAAPPPAVPRQAPPLCFNDLVQREVYDKGMHKPLIGRRCSKGYECSECAASWFSE